MRTGDFAMTSTPQAEFTIAYVPAPIEAVLGVWQFVREPFFRTTTARSLPGHLLHLLTAGHYRLKTNGREYRVSAGDAVYYHETESVEWHGDASQVVFYSVGFLAPQMPPLPIEQRVFRATPRMRRAFALLYQAWEAGRQQRPLAVHARLADLLDAIQQAGMTKSADTASDAASLWWHAESVVRGHRLFRPTLAQVCQRAATSRGKLIRACRKATGTTPIRRLREIRMEEARGLLQYAHLNVTQIADYLGYARIHEFTRDFTAFHGRPPREFKHPIRTEP
jgi:AraC-like DNA-binding protein